MQVHLDEPETAKLKVGRDEAAASIWQGTTGKHKLINWCICKLEVEPTTQDPEESCTNIF